MRSNRGRSVRPDRAAGDADPPRLARGDEQTLIRSHTVITAVPLVPELRMHLLTEACPLWRAGEKEAAAAGLVEPYWAFAWPGGQALARHVLDRPELVRGKRVLDFGSGGAVEAIAALRAGAASAVAADVDALAAVAARLNADLNGVALETTSEDVLGKPVDADVVLAGDVFYERELAERTIRWLRELAGGGAVVLLGDPTRGFLDVSGLRRAAVYDAPYDGEVTSPTLRPTPIYSIP
jgi:predicted nicotinamide N-methyase